MILIKDVLPAPLGPNRPNILPVSTRVDTSSSARWLAYCFTIFLISSIVCFVILLLDAPTQRLLHAVRHALPIDRNDEPILAGGRFFTMFVSDQNMDYATD